MVMFNPVIVQKKNLYETEEAACLYLESEKQPDIKKITVEYQDMNFTKQKKSFEGWTAQIIQHEVDHLEGIII